MSIETLHIIGGITGFLGTIVLILFLVTISDNSNADPDGNLAGLAFPAAVLGAVFPDWFLTVYGGIWLGILGIWIKRKIEPFLRVEHRRKVQLERLQRRIAEEEAKLRYEQQRDQLKQRLENTRTAHLLLLEQEADARIREANDGRPL